MIKNKKITEHFNFYEMTVSRDFPHLQEMNRVKCLEDQENEFKLYKLCGLLENVRALASGLFLGETPLLILSGYRYEGLNMAVGGSARSQHPKCGAADFTISGTIEATRLYIAIKESDLEWHQLIYYPKKYFIHISVATGSNDQQAFEWGSR